MAPQNIDLQSLLPEGVSIDDLSDEDRQTLEAALQEALAQAAAEDMQRQATFNSLAISLAEKRTEAIAFRANSGIEDEWIEDEEFYNGIDDVNRHESPHAIIKPLSSGASRPRAKKGRGSTIFPNITAPFTDAAAARMGDILLPTDDRNFALRAGKIPDLLAASGADPATVPPNPQIAAPDNPTQPADPNQPVQLPGGQTATAGAVADLADQERAKADKMALKAQDRIDDWLTEAQYINQVRRVIDDVVKIGTGVIKGPVPVKRTARVWRKDAATGQSTLVIEEKIAPASFRIDPWNLFPAPDCGEDIHKGSGIWEREYLSEPGLLELIGTPGLLEDELRASLKEGPVRYVAAGRYESKANEASEKNRQFELWHYHGVLTREQMEAAGCPCNEDDPDMVGACVTLLNDRIVRATFNPLSGYAFPYDVIPWKRRPGSPFGAGVPRQLRAPQRMAIGATRALMDSAGFAAGPQIVMKRSGIEPVNGSFAISPYKVWYATDEVQNVEQAFRIFQFPLLVKELQAIVQMAQKMAEDVTGLPMLLQGQQGHAPDTVGGMTMLSNNANSVLRRVARLFDAYTESHIGRYYQWLLEYGDDPEEKGDLFIEARGSSALIERDLQNQEMFNVMNQSLNPAFGMNPKKASAEYLKSRRFNPDTFTYTDAELEQMAQQPPPEDPRITAAKIANEGRMQVAQVNAHASTDRAETAASVMKERIASDTDRDVVYVQAQTMQTQSEHEGRMLELEMKERLAMLDYANKRQITLAEVKAELAQTTMKINATERLAHVKAPEKALPIKPPVEPPGQAADGESFQA